MQILLHPFTLAIIAALLPVLVMLFYIYRQDKVDPEPIPVMAKGVFFGVLSALLVILVVGLLDPVYLLGISPDTPEGAVATAFLDAAIPEECAKLFMLWLLLRKNPYYDDSIDGIVYAVCVGMGFAGFENILYLFGNLDNLAAVSISRALFAVPGHFFFAVAMGYFVSRAHFCTRFFSRRYFLILSILVPVFLHGVYDALLMVSQVCDDGVITGLCVLLFLVFCFILQLYGRRRIRRYKG